MYKVAIIDDEPMICRSLVEKIGWEQWNCTVCGTGVNGIEGKELIQQLRPDIVFTDVRMPGVNGLELSNFIKQHYPDIITIILSGYNEFEYAREAMRNQVFDYMLKPIDKHELGKTMQKALEYLNRKKSTRISIDREERKKKEITPLIESKIIMDALLNKHHEYEMNPGKIQGMGILLQKGQVVVLDIQTTWVTESSGSNYQFAVDNILQETFYDNGCKVNLCWIENKCVLVFKFTSATPSGIAHNRVTKAVKNGTKRLESFFKGKVFIGYGSFFNHKNDLHHSYQSALENLKKYSFWDIEDVMINSLVQTKTDIKVNEDMFKFLQEGNHSKSLFIFDQLIEQLQFNKDIDQVFRISIELLIRLDGILKEWEASYDLPTVNQIREYHTFHDLVANLRQIFINVCSIISKKRAFLHSPLMDKIIIFLQDQYAKPDTNLQFVANEFHLSVSHLSRLFKKETGENFKEYLSEMRVQKAKELLIEKYCLTIQETANEVGFTDGKYFSQVFKKYIGVTPSEYKMQIQHNHRISNIKAL